MAAMLWACAAIFFIAQNAHFGWNWTAKSDEKVICDGVGLVLIAIAAAATMKQA